MKQAFKMFMGSVMVYLAVASCVGMDVPTLSTSGAGGGGSGSTASRSAVASSVSAGGHGGVGTGNVGSTGSVLNPVPPAQAESGTRLKAMFMLGADGSKSFHDGYWWDSVLQTDCGFLPMSDGTKRCLPGTSIGVVLGNNYLDASCTQPYAVSITCGPMAKEYAVSTDSATYQPTWHIYALGAQVQPTDVYSKSSTGLCVKAALVSSFTYYALGVELPPSDFVAGTEGHE